MKDLAPTHIKVTSIEEWEYAPKEKTLETPSDTRHYLVESKAGPKRTTQGIVRTDKIEKAYEHDGWVILKLEGGETLTVTESLEYFAKRLCQKIES